MESRWIVENVRTDSHDHFMCSDYEWRVIDRQTGEVIASFSESYQGSQAEGASSVTISDDDREIIVKYHDGEEMRVPLPGA